MIPRRRYAGEIGTPSAEQLQPPPAAATGSQSSADPFSSRPDLYPPPNAVTFTAEDFWDSPAAVGTNEPAGLITVIPSNCIAIIRNLAQYINDMVAADDVRWQVRVGGAPVQRWNDLRMFPTLAAFRTVASEPYIRVPLGAEIRIRITNNTANAHKIGAAYDGWWWPDPAAAAR